jgi:cytochrome c553
VVKPLSDNEIADASAFYAAIEIKVGKVPGE